MIELIIDGAIVDEYSEYYFKLHPKAYKPPIIHPYHPSINEWMIMKRPMMNALKQKWKAFVVWVVQKYGFNGLQIENCDAEFTTYYKPGHRHDVDNSVPKMILDGFIEAGLLVDDDSKHLNSLKLMCAYDKDNPRTEIKLFINKEKKDVKEE